MIELLNKGRGGVMGVLLIGVFLNLYLGMVAEILHVLHSSFVIGQL